MIHVVVGVIENSHQQLLIAKRPPGKPYPDYWEFPGGKVELNETPLLALTRELHEEIGIDVISAEHWFTFTHVYPDRTVLLDVWHHIEFTAPPHGKEGQEIRWIDMRELADYQFPEGNKIIIDKLTRSP